MSFNSVFLVLIQIRTSMIVAPAGNLPAGAVNIVNSILDSYHCTTLTKNIPKTIP